MRYDEEMILFHHNFLVNGATNAEGLFRFIAIKCLPPTSFTSGPYIFKICLQNMMMIFWAPALLIKTKISRAEVLFQC